MTPQQVQALLDRSVSEGLFTIASGLEEGEKGQLTFRLIISVPTPNLGDLPPEVLVKVTIDDQFTWTFPGFALEDASLWRYPHLDRSNGKLCLRSSRVFLDEPWAMWKQAIAELKEWLEDAANGRLLEANQPWELPDFRHPLPKRSPRTKKIPPPPKLVWTVESPLTFKSWKERVGQHGVVDFGRHSHHKAIVPIQFTDGTGNSIDYPSPSSSFLDPGLRVRGVWLILDTLIYSHHRPPATFAELEHSCSRSGIPLWEVLADLIRRPPSFGYHYLLVGAPIPHLHSGENQEIHWQPIALPHRMVKARKLGASKTNLAPRIEAHIGSALIPWGVSENVSPTRILARGALDKDFNAKRVCIVGCGAIGSLIAEHLVRGGLLHLAMYDPQVLDLDNLCRHALAPAEVRMSKARGLETHFRGMDPSGTVRSFPLTVPPARITENEEAWYELEHSDVIFDCSADDAAFQWLSAFGRKHGKRIVHLFVNGHAKVLTVCVSGRNTSCLTVATKLFQDVALGICPISLAEYNPEVPEVSVGAGCWHPTFPALGTHIQMLVSSAVHLLQSLIAAPWKCGGTAIILRRTEPDLTFPAALPSPLVEVNWRQSYR